MSINKVRWAHILGGIGLVLLFAGILRLVLEITHPVGVGVIDCGSGISPPEIGGAIHGDSTCSAMISTARLMAVLLLSCGALMFGAACIVASRRSL